MKQTILTCDRCKKVVEKNEDLNTLRLVFTNSRHYSYSSGQYLETKSNVPEVDWCNVCLGETGFATITNHSATAAITTIEDMIREMVREEAREVVREVTGA